MANVMVIGMGGVGSVIGQKLHELMSNFSREGLPIFVEKREVERH